MRREAKLEDMVKCVKLLQTSDTIQMLNPYVIPPFDVGSVKFHYLFLLLNLDFMGVCNKKSIDLPFSGIMSIAKPTLNQGDNAHGHYTVFTS
ncbi:hypothetical protein EAI89_23130, partial [Eubacterium sp. am_0171]